MTEVDVERARLCAEEIAKICQQYNCIIIPEMKFYGKEIISAIHVVAQEVEINADGIKVG